MRAGRLVQVGTPEEIYSRPVDRFVAEFVGEVNTISVRAGADGLWDGVDVAGRFKIRPPESGELLDKAFVVVRPEFMRFLGDGESADNRVEGIVYNEYALGSRIQYQVRVGEQVFIVEKLRQQAFAGNLDDNVLIGWDAKDSILVTD